MFNVPLNYNLPESLYFFPKPNLFVFLDKACHRRGYNITYLYTDFSLSLQCSRSIRSMNMEIAFWVSIFMHQI